MATSDLDRFIVTVGDGALAVHIHLGEVAVDVNIPMPAGYGDMSLAQQRLAVLRHARRALEVAREELDDGDG
jgi:hypothetical protein